MAIWQFDFHVIPNEFLDSATESSDEYLWDNKKISKSSIKFPDFLKIIKSNDDEIQCGDYDKTCINYLFENNYLSEMFCRIDLREFNIDLLKEIVLYFQQMDGSILYNDRVYMLSEDILKRLILSSDTYRFCTAPSDFLNDLKNNKINL